MVSQWSINRGTHRKNKSLSNSSIQKVVFHYPIGYWLYIYIWFYHDLHCLNWGCKWNYPCTTCETLYDVLYFHDMLNILSHIFNKSLYVVEYHGISLRHILPTPKPTRSQAPSSASNAVLHGAPTRPRAEVLGHEAGIATMVSWESQPQL